MVIYFIFLLHSLFEAQYEEGCNPCILCGTDEVTCQYSRSASHLPAAGRDERRLYLQATDEGDLFQTLHINPLSPNSDQHQFSPNNIHTLSRDKVMRIN